MQRRARLTPLLALSVFALVFSGCGGKSSPTSPTSPTTPTTPPQVNGTYTVAGQFTQSGLPEKLNNNGLFGTMFITSQSDTTATDSVALVLMDAGSWVLSIDSLTSDSALAVLDSLNGGQPVVPVSIAKAQAVILGDGSFSVTFNGKVSSPQFPDSVYQLMFNGVVGSDGSITGQWGETWGGCCHESGGFTATPH